MAAPPSTAIEHPRRGHTGPARMAPHPAAAQRTGDLYHLPQMMAILAEIEAKNGNFNAAEAAYAQATDAVNGLLRDFPHPRHKNTLIATMSRVFQGHFELALDNLHDVAKAFAVVESAKAHGLVDLLHGSSARQGEAWDQHAVRRVAELQRGLSHERDQRRRSELLDQLWELEMRSFRSRDVGLGYHAPSTSDQCRFRDCSHVLRITSC